MRLQSPRIAAFLQADARLMFCWPRSASYARSQVWLGLPNGRFQSGGSLWIPAATARWWSSCGELRAICPKSRKRLSVTRWERGRHRWLLWLPHSSPWPGQRCFCTFQKFESCLSTEIVTLPRSPGQLHHLKYQNRIWSWRRREPYQW